MLSSGIRSSPARAGRSRSGHSRRTPRSKSRSNPAGSSFWTRIVSRPGRNASDAGCGSRFTIVAATPSARATSANPSSEPSASPSGALCEVISTRLARFSRANAAPVSRVGSGIAVFPGLGPRLLVAGLVIVRPRPGGGNLVEHAGDAVGALETQVALELEVRRVVHPQPLCALVAKEAARLDQAVRGLAHPLVVAEDREEGAGQLQVAGELNRGDYDAGQARVLDLGEQELREHLPHGILQPFAAHEGVTHDSPPTAPGRRRLARRARHPGNSRLPGRGRARRCRAPPRRRSRTR